MGIFGAVLATGPREGGDPMGAEQAQQEEGDGEEDGQKKHAGEHPGSAAGVPPALMNGVFGGPAHPQHQAGAVDEVVDGDSQIQGASPAVPRPWATKKVSARM